MTLPTAGESLYALLPAYLRFRDAEEGEPLRALFAVLEREYAVLRDDIGALYDDWFIETCAEWVVPYLGDLLGVRGLDHFSQPAISPRSLVGNLMRHRRRKGTPAALGEVTTGATGWPALAVPSAGLLAATQPLTALRPERGGTVNLRDTAALDRLGGPFDTVPRTVDVRRNVVANLAAGEVTGIATLAGAAGRYNLGRVGLFLWRLGSYPVERSTPCEIRPGCYTFHPFGLDAPLFNPPRTGELSADWNGDPAAFPGPLSRRLLGDEIRALSLREEPSTRFFAGSPALQVWVRYHGTNGALRPIPARAILFCDLSGWQLPAGDGAGSAQRPVQVGVDPELGRLAFPPGVEVEAVQVSYAYGFSADLGGGPYPRPEPAGADWEATVLAAATADAGTRRFATLAEALAAWTAADGDGLIRIADNGTYAVPAAAVLLAAGRRLTVAASPGMRPCLTGRLTVQGPDGRSGTGTGFALEGLWMAGGVTVQGGVDSLSISHCTVAPPPRTGAAPPAVEVAGAAPTALEMVIQSSITGPLRLPPEMLDLRIADSIVDGGEVAALSGPGGASGPRATLVRSTFFGAVALREITLASEVLFTAPLTVARRQHGEVLSCSLPLGSATPHRTRCPTPEPGTAHLINPVFTSRVYGHPGYAQLAPTCPAAASGGSRDGSETGAFHALRQPHRRAALPFVLAEYLPWGMEAEILYVT